MQSISLGNYTLNVDLRITAGCRAKCLPQAMAYSSRSGPMNTWRQATTSRSPSAQIPRGLPIAGLASVEAGKYVDGRWVAGRRLSGDDVVLRYDLAAAAAVSQSGSGLRFGTDGPTIQRVKLYRYE